MGKPRLKRKKRGGRWEGRGRERERAGGTKLCWKAGRQAIYMNCGCQVEWWISNFTSILRFNAIIANLGESVENEKWCVRIQRRWTWHLGPEKGLLKMLNNHLIDRTALMAKLLFGRFFPCKKKKKFLSYARTEFV